jgi:protein required for attachment to host cells
MVRVFVNKGDKTEANLQITMALGIDHKHKSRDPSQASDRSKP